MDYWRAHDDDPETRRGRLGEALAKAVGRYGDAGVKAIRPLIRPGDIGSQRFRTLEHAATPLAVRAAEDLHAADREEGRIALLRVKVAAGEPFRTEGLLAALDDPSRKVVSAAVEQVIGGSVWGSYDPWHPVPPERRVSRVSLDVLAKLRYMALSREPAARWEPLRSLPEIELPPPDGPRAQEEPYAWGEPVNGLAVGVRRPRFDGSSPENAHVSLDIALRSLAQRPIRVWLSLAKWHLVPAPGGPLAAKNYTYSFAEGRAVVRPRDTVRVGGSFWATVLRREDPLVTSLRVELRVPDDPDIHPEWAGTVTSGPVELRAPSANDTSDLAHWRAFLTEAFKEGRLPEGGRISLGTHPGGPVAPGSGVAIGCGDRIASDGLWRALPADLLRLSPEETRRVCRFLLDGDRFAHAIFSDNEYRGKYPPRAHLWLQSATKWACWGGVTLTEPFDAGWMELMESLLAPRAVEARRRLGIKSAR